MKSQTQNEGKSEKSKKISFFVLPTGKLTNFAAAKKVPSSKREKHPKKPKTETFPKILKQQPKN